MEKQLNGGREEGWVGGSKEEERGRKREGKRESQTPTGNFRITTFRSFSSGLITSENPSSYDFFQPSNVMSY